MSPGKHRRDWNGSCKEPKYDAGPAHTLRHVGPSEDALEGYRTLEQIGPRGRWRGKTSVLRYAKTHMLLAAKARVPVRVRELGQERMRALGQRSEKPKL